MRSIFCLLVFFHLAYTRHFGYHHQKSWHKHAQSCSGMRQSPVGIQSEKALPLAIPALEMIGFHNLVPRPITVTNNGHSVEIRPGRKFATVFGAFLNGQYEIEGIHFHWGKSNNRGSEHVINGMRFALEMHIVTKNVAYETISEALDHQDGLAVLAFFFDVREEESQELEPIVSGLNMIRPEGSRSYLTQSFTLASLLPKNTGLFYTYKGSLTTPPCSEAVTWIIFPDPMPVSYFQMREFRHLSSENEVLADNYRHIQQLGKRKVFVRRFPTEVADLHNIYRNYSSQEFWE